MRAFTKIFALLVVVSSFTYCTTTKFTSIHQTNTYKVDSSIAEDTSIINYYLPFKNRLENEMNRVIGYSEYHLTKSRSQVETTAGNFLVDALLEIGKSIDPNTQFAIATKGGIRAEIKQGNITVGNIFELMPFENSITFLELSGKDLMTLANFIAKTGGQPVAGLTMNINDNLPTNIVIANQPFDINKTYKLVTYDYLANGGDYIEGLEHPLTRQNTGIVVRNGLIDYIERLTKEGKTINTKLDGRVKIVK